MTISVKGRPLSLFKRREVIAAIAGGMKKRDILREFGCSESQYDDLRGQAKRAEIAHIAAAPIRSSVYFIQCQGFVEIGVADLCVWLRGGVCLDHPDAEDAPVCEPLVLEELGEAATAVSRRG